jgi:hypothetical protein
LSLSARKGQSPALCRRAGPAPGEPLAPLKTYLWQQEQAQLDLAIRQSDGDKEQVALLLGIN